MDYQERKMAEARQRRKQKRKLIAGSASLGAILLAILLFFTLFFVRVPTGYTGIVTTFGKVADYTLEAGAHLKSPIQKIIMMDNREQKLNFEALAFSSDTQEVRVLGSINYNIDKATAMRLYREVGVNYADILITPRLLENVKGVLAQYKADGLVSKRASLSDTIKDVMVDELKEYGVNIISAALHDIDFSDAYTNAVEAKQVAEQAKLQNAIMQEQLTNEARQNAEREVIKAEAELTKAQKEADAQAYSITAKAEAEAEANIKLAQSITPELTSYLEIQQWDGKRVMEIHGATPLIQIPAPTE